MELGLFLVPNCYQPFGRELGSTFWVPLLSNKSLYHDFRRYDSLFLEPPLHITFSFLLVLNLNETVYNIVLNFLVFHALQFRYLHQISYFVHLLYFMSNYKQSLATGPEILFGDVAHARISTLFVNGSVFSIFINIYPSDCMVVHLFQFLCSLN